MALDEPSQEDLSATTQGPVCCRQRSGTLLTQGWRGGSRRREKDIFLASKPVSNLIVRFGHPQVGAV
jgi:hypothetical protein